MAKESNLGFHAATKNDEARLETVHNENTAAAEAALNKMMRPELINRFDGIITFRALMHKQISKIFDNLINELQQRLIPKGLHLVIKPAAKRKIIEMGYNEKFGARPLRRTIQDEIEHRIADGILSGKFEKGSVLVISLKNKEISIDAAREA
jgi:ATP-dependent Clp protease ATP-binding subunit ClpC